MSALKAGGTATTAAAEETTTTIAAAKLTGFESFLPQSLFFFLLPSFYLCTAVVMDCLSSMFPMLPWEGGGGHI